MALQHLFRRNATYYFRCVVPRQFIPFFHHKEIRFSLKTTSLETAKRKIHCINVQLDTFFSKIDTIVVNFKENGIKRVNIDYLEKKVG